MPQWLHQDMVHVTGEVPSRSKVDWHPNRTFFDFGPKAKKVRFDVSGFIRPWMEVGPHQWHGQCLYVAIDPIWNRTIFAFIFKNELKHLVCASAPSRHGRPRADTGGPEPSRHMICSQRGASIHKAAPLFTLLWISVNISSHFVNKCERLWRVGAEPTRSSPSRADTWYVHKGVPLFTTRRLYSHFCE